MADYNANIKVNADTRQAESQLKKLQNSLDKLSNISSKVNLQSAQQQFSKLGTALKGVGERGALGAITLGAGKATVAIGGLGAKMGVVGAAAASMGAAVNGALGGVPGLVTDILAQVGNIPNAFGLAAVAAMAFAPQVLKASSATVGLGAAIDKAVGTQTTQKIANVVDGIGQLNVELNATKATFAALVEGSTLNQLNKQLKDAVKESGAFRSSTEDAVVAAEQLVTVQKEQRREQKAITDLIRQAQGLQPQDVRDTEVARRVALLKSREIQQKKDLQLQNQINTELAEYERLADKVANQTKQWANNLDRIARSSKAGVLGNRSQVQARLQEFRENRRSADIARARSARLIGEQYSLAQVPARGELLPGGRTETASPQFRSLLNEQARIRQASATALERSEKTLIGLQAQTLRTEKSITAAKREQEAIDERSIQIIREQNALLLKRISLERRKPIAALTPQQRVSTGVLDPESLRFDRLQRVKRGRELQARQKEALSNAVIGGAFPLLFGQGAGAALGGGLGGAAGGFAGGQFGFGLSLVGTALGSAIDTFTAAAIESGKSLNDPIKNFQKLAEAGLIASRGQQKYIEQLIEAGRVTEAAALIQQEIVQKIGVSGVTDLQNAGAASGKLSKALAEFSIQAQAAVAGPLAALLSWLAGVVEIGNNVRREAARQTDILEGLSPQDKELLKREEQRILQGATIFNEAEKRRQVSELYSTFAPKSTVKAPGASVDKTPELQAKAVTEELAAQVKLEAEKLTLTGLSVEKDGMRYVTAAKNVALQEYKNKLLEIANSWIGKAYDAEKNQLLIRQANLRLAQKNRDIDREAARVAEQANDERIRAYQQQLQLQNQLAQTVLDEYRIFEQGVDLFKGPIAGYEKSLILLERRIALQEGIIRNEYESVKVSKEYAANQATIDATFDNRLNNLKLEEDLLKSQLLVQRERARLEQEISTAQLESQNKQRRVAGQTEIDRLQTELAFPFGGEQLERDMQMLDQYTRRINELVPLQDRLAELQKTITRAEATPGLLTEDQLNTKREEFNIQQDQLNQLTAELQIRDQLEQQLLRQQQIYAKYGFIADEVSRALSDSISGLVTGTTTVAEAFGRMFENIGKAFIDLATQILAQQLFIQVVSALLPGGFGATDSRGFSFGSLVDAFADGGYVTGPTNAIIGEGGEPEYVIPASKMAGAMARYASGLRGGGVIDGAVSDNRNFLDSLTTGINGSSADMSEQDAATAGAAATRASLRETERFRENQMQIMNQQTERERRFERERIEQMASTPGNLNIRYESQVINNVEYVTRDQAERLASQSALRGRELAINALQTSVKTRKRVGMA